MIGLPGLRGPSGGAAGPQGPIGPQGSAGAASSVVGPKGDAGAIGAQGPAGAAGSGFGAGAAVHYIGEQYQGGIVYWVQADGQHGLIAARANQPSNIQWHNGTVRLTGASGDGIGAGAMNTAIIVATQIGDNQAGNFAAKVAADYSIQDDGVTACTGSSSEICYGDWYLPSKVELYLLFAQKYVVGGFAGGSYWSSSESSSGNAWSQGFGIGKQWNDFKYSVLPVRAVRAF